MSKLIVMVGLPGSGKSTLIRGFNNHLSLSYYQVFSSDTYREKLLGDENDQTGNELVFKTLYADLRAALQAGKNCVFDATNTTLKARRRIFEQIKDISQVEEVVAIVMSTPFEECVWRDSNRDRTVGRDVIYKFYSSFQFPQQFEGFSRIYIDKYLTALDFDSSVLGYRSIYQKPLYCPNIAAMLRGWMLNFDQKNPHHKYTLKEHCDRVAEAAPNHVSYVAGLFHDIGKTVTQVFDDKGIAHYYNHDSIGTYIMMQYVEALDVMSWVDVNEVLFLINYHMRAHNDFKSAKAEKKYKELFGELRFARLMQFGECDQFATGKKGENDVEHSKSV